MPLPWSRLPTQVWRNVYLHFFALQCTMGKIGSFYTTISPCKRIFSLGHCYPVNWNRFKTCRFPYFYSHSAVCASLSNHLDLRVELVSTLVTALLLEMGNWRRFCIKATYILHREHQTYFAELEFRKVCNNLLCTHIYYFAKAAHSGLKMENIV